MAATRAAATLTREALHDAAAADFLAEGWSEPLDFALAAAKEFGHDGLGLELVQSVQVLPDDDGKMPVLSRERLLEALRPSATRAAPSDILMSAGCQKSDLGLLTGDDRRLDMIPVCRCGCLT